MNILRSWSDGVVELNAPPTPQHSNQVISGQEIFRCGHNAESTFSPEGEGICSMHERSEPELEKAEEDKTSCDAIINSVG